jgi:hypothetical protein
MTSSLSTNLATRFEDAVVCTREVLTQQGFGVLTEIDVRETLKSKLGVEMEDLRQSPMRSPRSCAPRSPRWVPPSSLRAARPLQALPAQSV